MKLLVAIARRRDQFLSANLGIVHTFSGAIFTHDQSITHAGATSSSPHSKVEKAPCLGADVGIADTLVMRKLVASASSRYVVVIVIGSLAYGSAEVLLEGGRLDGAKRSSGNGAGGRALDILIDILQVRWLLGAIRTNHHAITSTATTSRPKVPVFVWVLARIFPTNIRLAFALVLLDVVASASLVAFPSLRKPDNFHASGSAEVLLGKGGAEGDKRRGNRHKSSEELHCLLFVVKMSVLWNERCLRVHTVICFVRCCPNSCITKMPLMRESFHTRVSDTDIICNALCLRRTVLRCDLRVIVISQASSLPLKQL